MGVKQRLKDFIKSQDISVNKFEKLCGLSTGYVGNMRVSIQPEKLMSISQMFPELNTGWLLTGEGEMLKTSGKSGGTGDVVEFVRLLPISAQGGSLNDFIIAVKDSDCEQVVSPVRGADFAMSVAGDSMTPEYPSGAQILIKKINARAFIDWGKVYVLDTCNGSIIKKVFPSDDPEKLKCVSINSEYPPFEVSLEDVFGIYRVLLCMSVK